jgi:hypothetical protein
MGNPGVMMGSIMGMMWVPNQNHQKQHGSTLAWISTGNPSTMTFNDPNCQGIMSGNWHGQKWQGNSSWLLGCKVMGRIRGGGLGGFLCW